MDETLTLYLPNDTSAKAAGADRLAAAWAEVPDLHIVRTSSRGAFFLEPLVERDGPQGRLLWPRAKPDDLSNIRKGAGGIRIADIPFLAQQPRAVFARFGTTQPLSLEEYRAQGGWRGRERANGMPSEAIIAEIKSSGLRGRGGAAFPVWYKWDAARQQRADK